MKTLLKILTIFVAVGAYNFRPALMWRYKGQKHIQKMQYVYWAFFPIVSHGYGGSHQFGKAYAEERKSLSPRTVLPGEGHGFSPEAKTQVIEAITKLLTDR